MSRKLNVTQHVSVEVRKRDQVLTATLEPGTVDAAKLHPAVVDKLIELKVATWVTPTRKAGKHR